MQQATSSARKEYGTELYSLGHDELKNSHQRQLTLKVEQPRHVFWRKDLNELGPVADVFGDIISTSWNNHNRHKLPGTMWRFYFCIACEFKALTLAMRLGWWIKEEVSFLVTDLATFCICKMARSLTRHPHRALSPAAVF